MSESEKIEIKYSADENSKVVEELTNKIIEYAKSLYPNRYAPEIIHTHEIAECMRRSFFYRKYKIFIDNIESAFHFTTGNLYEDFLEAILTEKRTRWIEREEAAEGKKYGKYRHISHIDFGTADKKLGIIELKSIKNWSFLMDWPSSTFIANIYYYKKREKEHHMYQRPKGPNFGDLDRLLMYMATKNISTAILIYISKTMYQGLAIFKIKLGQIGKDYIQGVIDIKAAQYADFLDKYLNNPTPIKEMKYIINNIPAHPSVWCRSCAFGGFYDANGNKTIKNGILKNVENMLGFELSNYCSTTFKQRKYTKSIYSTKETDGQPIEYPQIPQLSVNYDADTTELFCNKIIDILDSRFLWAYQYSLLFECPRKAYFYNNYPIKDLLTNNPYNKSLAIWMFLQGLMADKLIWVYDRDHSEFDVSIKYKGFEYNGEVHRINGVLSIVVPTAEISETRIKYFPRWTDIYKCILIRNLSNEPVRLIYHGIRTTNILAYDVKEAAPRYISNIMIEAHRKIELIEKGVPEPDRWCTWCPILRLKNTQTGEFECPKGRLYVQATLNQPLSVITQSIPKMPILINGVKKMIPKFWIDPLEEMFEEEPEEESEEESEEGELPEP